MKGESEMELNIAVQRQGDVLTIKLSGRMTFNTVPEFDRAFAESSGDKREIRIDMSELIYIASMGIRSLLSAKKASDASGTAFAFVSPTDSVMEILSVTGLDTIIDIISDEEDESRSAETFPLRTIQRRMLGARSVKARTGMMNTARLFRLAPTVDLPVLADAVNSVIADNDIFRCRIAQDPEFAVFNQRFDGDLPAVTTEEMPAEEFEQIIATLRKPFALNGEPLWTVRIISTPAGSYLFMDFCPGIMDSAAIDCAFLPELDRRYTALSSDSGQISSKGTSYADFLAGEMQTAPEQIAAGDDYWLKMLEGFSAQTHLPPADHSGENAYLTEIIAIPAETVSKAFFSEKDGSAYSFFLGAALLTLAKLTRRSDVIMSRLDDGRTSQANRVPMGLTTEQYPIRWNFAKGQTASEFLAGLSARIQESAAYRASLGAVYDAGSEDETACYIMRRDSALQNGRLKLGDTWAEIIPLPGDATAAPDAPDFEIISNADGSYSLLLHYNAGSYSRDAMLQFGRIYCDMAASLRNDSTDLSSLL